MSIIKAADRFVGVPYVVHGRDPRGWDCWGCVCYLRNELLGKPTPSWAEVYNALDFKNTEKLAQAIKERMGGWHRYDTPKTGHILLLKTLGVECHVGLYLDKGLFIHACNGCQTAIVPLENWKARFVGSYDTE
jgi:cell wall-associated NlpC family hydrolase